MPTKPEPDLRVTFALAVHRLAALAGAEAERLAAKGKLDAGETRSAADLAQVLSALSRGPLWNAHRILESEQEKARERPSG